MTDAELDALEAAAKAATPGPWGIDPVFNIMAKEEYVYLDEDDGIGRVNNIKYIAAANPAAILELIAELREIKADRDSLEELVNDYIGGKAELDELKLKDAEAERDWLAKMFAASPLCPVDKPDLLIEIAKEAVCQK